MPFRSQAQRRWMFANHPQMAKRWAAHTPKGTSLPQRIREFCTSGSVGGFMPGALVVRPAALPSAFPRRRKRSASRIREQILEFMYSPTKYGWQGKVRHTIANKGNEYSTSVARAASGGLMGGAQGAGLIGTYAQPGMFSGSGPTWNAATSPWSGLKIKSIGVPGTKTGRHQAKAPLFNRMRRHAGA